MSCIPHQTMQGTVKTLTLKAVRKEAPQLPSMTPVLHFTGAINVDTRFLQRLISFSLCNYMEFPDTRFHPKITGPLAAVSLDMAQIISNQSLVGSSFYNIQ